MNYGSIGYSAPPLSLNGQAPTAGGFTFDFPLAALQSFLTPAITFNQQTNTQNQGFLGGIINQQNQSLNNAAQSNVALNQTAQPILGNFLTMLGQSSIINSQAGLYTTQHSGGLFGGGGFLGLGL